MSALFKSFGRPLALFFALMATLWATVLIIAPQLWMLDSAMRLPDRQKDSAVAATLMADARTCQSVIRTFLEAEAEAATAPADNGGLAVPSIGGGSSGSNGGLATPSIGGMATPSIGGGSGLPYILQCDRTTTDIPLVRGEDAVSETLASAYDLPVLEVDASASAEEQIAQAEAVFAIVEPLQSVLVAAEAEEFPYTAENFEQIWAPRAIPMTPETRAEADAEFDNQLFDALGVRYEESGVVQLRLTLATLLRTLFFAVAATVLALIVAYPIAYNLALASTGRKAIALFVALIIPYAVVEIMRVYAWVSIVENRGVLNQFLDMIGVIDLEAGEAIAFKRSALTIFMVIIYTYMLYMVFPIVSAMSTLDKNQIEAGRDLGASTWRLHRRIIIPHSKPGIVVGVITTFMLCAGAFSVPQIVSRGLQAEWFSQTIYTKFHEASDTANIGAAYAFFFTAVCFAMVALFMWLTRARLKDFVRS